MQEPKIPEQTCEGCKNRDRMIRELAERVDELDRLIRYGSYSGKITATYPVENRENINEKQTTTTKEPA